MTETEIFNNIPQPDPAWDYYEVWQSLHIAQFKIKNGLQLVLGQEVETRDTNQKLKEILESIVDRLEEILENDLTGYADEEIY